MYLCFFMIKNQIHIGKAIHQRLKEIGMTKAEFAKRIHCTRQNIYSIFERKELNTNLLRKISEVLGYNFLVDQMEDVQCFVVLVTNKIELHKLQSNPNLEILTSYELPNNNDVSVR